MTSARAAAGLLRPELLSRLASARRYRVRFGPASVRPWRVAPAAASCRLDLVPPRFDLTAGVVVDIGANVGDWTGALLSVAPRLHVLAVEAASDPWAQLTERFASNDRVETVRAAVGDQAGTATLHVTGHSHNSSLKMPRDMDGEYGSGWDVRGEETVPLTTLDDLMGARRASLIKIDVQGGERGVISGGHRTLSTASVVLIEANLRSHYVDDLLFPELHALLADLGYALVGLSQPRLGQSGDALWLDACYANQSRADD